MSNREDVVASLNLQAKIRLLSGGDYWRTEAVEGVPSLLLSDGPHGLRVQKGGTSELSFGDSVPATCFPTAVTLASTWDVELAAEVGSALGAEARQAGVDVVLGPGLNLKRHPAGGRNFEYFSEDPHLSGKLAAAVVRGIQSRGVGACPKHFVVNTQERARMRVDAVVDNRTLRELYLAAFEIVVREAQPWAIMSAYNRVNGEHVGESRELIEEILRQEWGFDGVVLSDWFATFDRPAGIRAGMDLEMPGSNGMWDRAVEHAVKQDELSIDDIDAACERIVRLARRVAGEPVESSKSLHADHHALARRVAAAGTVLLTNDGILPLSPGQRVGVIGAFAKEPRFQGGGSSRVQPTRLDALLTCLREDADVVSETVAFAPGYDHATGTATPEQIDEAVATARHAEVVILVVGLPTNIESEGWDRDQLGLPEGMNRLIEAVTTTNPRTVVVLQHGAPVLLPWADQPAAIVEAWLGGQAGGAALLDVLLGRVEPGGRLPESFPTSAAELPADVDFSDRPTQVVHREGLHVGYRFYDTFDVAPAFCFGHGLGYTTWSWDDARVDGDGVDRTVTVRLTNTGTRYGVQVVQLYVRDPESSVHRPAHELKGFVKVGAGPGESVEVSMPLDSRTFAVWDVASSSWRVEAGEYELQVGASSRDIRSVLAIDVTGSDDVTPVPRPAGAVMTDDELAVLLGEPVPTPRPLLPFHRDSAVEDLDQTGLGRFVGHILRIAQRTQLPDAPDEQARLFIEESIREAPFRLLAAGVGGRRALDVLDGVIRLLNASGGNR